MFFFSVWGHRQLQSQTEKKTNKTKPALDQFVDSCGSSCHNFADRRRSTVMCTEPKMCGVRRPLCFRAAVNYYLYKSKIMRSEPFFPRVRAQFFCRVNEPLDGLKTGIVLQELPTRNTNLHFCIINCYIL